MTPLDRLRRVACTLAAGALLPFPSASTTTTTDLATRIMRDSMRPLPSTPGVPASRPDSVWVPDRWIAPPGSASPVLVPGHWERVLSPREVYTPPLVVVDPTTGATAVVPAGPKPPVESRVGP